MMKQLFVVAALAFALGFLVKTAAGASPVPEGSLVQFRMACKAPDVMEGLLEGMGYAGSEADMQARAAAVRAGACLATPTARHLWQGRTLADAAPCVVDRDGDMVCMASVQGPDGNPWFVPVWPSLLQSPGQDI